MRHSALILVVLALTACATSTPPNTILIDSVPVAETTPAPPTAEEAARFVVEAEARLAALNVDYMRAAWIQSTYISHDSQIIAARENEKLINAGVELAKSAARFDDLELPYDTRRKLDTIKLGLTSPAPSDPALTAELARIASELEATYGAGQYCPPGKTGDDCLDVGEIANVLRTSRNPAELLEAWRGWHTISPPMRGSYTRFVELMNS
ncbi:MAG TPA: M2 family metallopeptidase, partial [Thermoanaerobaculia bacterium]